MVTIINTADNHVLPPSHLFYEDALGSLRQIVDLCNDKDADYLTIAGDLFEHGNPHPESVARLKDEMRRLRRTKVVIAGGNHDQSKIMGGHRNPIDAYLSGESWCLESVDGDPKVIEDNGFHFAVVPWLRIAGRAQLQNGEQHLRDQIMRVGDGIAGHPSFLFGHIALEEASFSSGRRGAELDKATTMLEPLVGSALLDTLDVGGWRLGHIHKRQDIGSRSGGYVGSSYKTSFGERNEEKGVDIITIDSSNQMTLEFYPLEVRQLVQVNLRDEPSGLSVVQHQLKKNDILRVLMEPDVDMSPKQDKVYRELERMGILIQERSLPRPATNTLNRIRGVNTETTPVDAFEMYLEASDLEDDQREKIRSSFESIYHEVIGA